MCCLSGDGRAIRASIDATRASVWIVLMGVSSETFGRINREVMGNREMAQGMYALVFVLKYLTEKKRK